MSSRCQPCPPLPARCHPEPSRSGVFSVLGFHGRFLLVGQNQKLKNFEKLYGLKLPGESRVLPKRALSHLVYSPSLPETIVFLCEFRPQWTAVTLENHRLYNCFGPCVQAPATGSPIWLVSGHPRHRSQATREGGL